MPRVADERRRQSRGAYPQRVTLMAYRCRTAMFRSDASAPDR